MEQLTLEQAAANHSRRSCVNHVAFNRTAQEIDNIAFQAGAEWKKEQYSPIKIASERALDYLSVKYPKEAEILHELKKAIELLQD